VVAKLGQVTLVMIFCEKTLCQRVWQYVLLLKLALFNGFLLVIHPKIINNCLTCSKYIWINVYFVLGAGGGVLGAGNMVETGLCAKT
jgi:hypothetical protein